MNHWLDWGIYPTVCTVHIQTLSFLCTHKLVLKTKQWCLWQAILSNLCSKTNRGFGVRILRFLGSSKVDGWVVSGWGKTIKWRELKRWWGSGTDDLLRNETNTAWASWTVWAHLPQLHICLQAAWLLFYLDTNHHTVPETEGDCGFVC